MKATKRKRDAASPAKRDVESPSNSPPAIRRVVLSAHCTVRDSIALRVALLELIDEPLPVVLDVTAVERIDTAAMQVVCAFMRDRRAAGRATQLQGTADAFSEAAHLLGLQHAFAELGAAA